MIHSVLEVIACENPGYSSYDKQAGDNAILKATRFVNEYMEFSETFSVEDRFLGKGSVNVGSIHGGTAVNAVPDFCRIEIDRGIVPGETPELAVRQVKAILKKLKISAAVEQRIGRNAFRLDEKSEIVDTVRNISGAKTKLTGATGYTEAELYKTKANIDSVVFGPGMKDVIHQPNEYIPVANLKKYTPMMEKIIKKWIG